MPTTAARPKDRRETEAKLLAAGVRVMSSLGYDAATTKRIAEAAGVNEQLISRYFGGKEGVLVAILDAYTSSEFTRELALRPEPAATVEEEIVAFLLEADFSAQREPFARLALGRALVDGKIAQALNNLRISCYRPLLQERLKVHAARGAIDPSVDMDAVVDALIHARLGLAAYGRLLFQLGSERLNDLCRIYGEAFARALAAREFDERDGRIRTAPGRTASGAARAAAPRRGRRS